MATQTLTAKEMRKVMLTPTATAMPRQTENVMPMLMATMTATENSTGFATHSDYTMRSG